MAVRSLAWFTGGKLLSPKAWAKPAKLLLACHRDPGRRRTLPDNFDRVSRLWFAQFCAGCLQWLAGRRQHRKGVPFSRAGRSIGNRLGRQNDGLRTCRRCRNYRREAGIVDNAFGPFPIGINTNDGHIDFRLRRDREFWKARVQDKQQREQHPADEGKISRQGHSLLHDFLGKQALSHAERLDQDQGQRCQGSKQQGRIRRKEFFADRFGLNARH
jgi:hypothetical protein